MTRARLAALLALSLALPCAAADQADDYYCVDVRGPFYAPALGVMRPVRPLSASEPFTITKPAGTKRVFVAGESVAAILGGGEAVEKAVPGLEIINAGMNGYDSWRIAGVAGELPKYSPDMLVLLSGNNESGSEPCPGPRAELRRRRFKLAERYYSLAGGPLPPPVLASLGVHEGRLRGMVRAARKAGVPVVLATLPANLMMPPAGRPPLDNPAFASALADLEAGAFRRAAGRFSSLAAGPSADPFSAYYAGLAFYQSGDKARAAAMLARAADLAPSQERAGPARNAMIARVAAEEGACLADLDAAFRKASPDGIPGFAQFTDGVHWTAAYGGLAWNAIFSAAAGCGIPAAATYRGLPAAGGAASAEDGAAKRVSYAASWLEGTRISERSVAELGYVLREAPAALAAAASSPKGLSSVFIRNDWSGATAARLDEIYPGFAANAAEAYRRAGRFRDGLALCDKALAALPGDKELLLLRARLLYGAGRRGEALAAMASLSSSAKGWPEGLAAAAEVMNFRVGRNCAGRRSPAEAKRLSDEGVGRLAAGDRAGALALLRRAAAAEPPSAEALMTLCSVSAGAEAAGYCSLAGEAAMDPCTGGGPERDQLAAEAFGRAAALESAAGLKAEAARDSGRAAALRLKGPR